MHELVVLQYNINTIIVVGVFKVMLIRATTLLAQLGLQEIASSPSLCNDIWYGIWYGI
jgi:hypothetical protein